MSIILCHCENTSELIFIRNKSPDPAAPYIIKLYTSMYFNSFIVDAGSALSYSLPVPFDPGSQYGAHFFEAINYIADPNF